MKVISVVARSKIHSALGYYVVERIFCIMLTTVSNLPQFPYNAFIRYDLLCSTDIENKFKRYILLNCVISNNHLINLIKTIQVFRK